MEEDENVGRIIKSSDLSTGDTENGGQVKFEYTEACTSHDLTPQIENPDDDGSCDYDLADGASMDNNFDDGSSCCISEVSSVSFQNVSLVTEVDDVNTDADFPEESADDNFEQADATPVVLRDQDLFANREFNDSGDESYNEKRYSHGNSERNLASVPVVIIPSGYEQVDEIPPISAYKPVEKDSYKEDEAIQSNLVSSSSSERINAAYREDMLGRRSPGLARRFLPEIIVYDDLSKSRSSPTMPGRAVRSAETARNCKSSCMANEMDDRRARMNQLDTAYRQHVAMVMNHSYEDDQSDLLNTKNNNGNNSTIDVNESPTTADDDDSQASSRRNPAAEHNLAAAASATMPSVEDGLSSGNESEDDNDASANKAAFIANHVTSNSVPTVIKAPCTETNGQTCSSELKATSTGVKTEQYSISNSAQCDNLSGQNTPVEPDLAQIKNMTLTEGSENCSVGNRNGRVRVEIPVRPAGVKVEESLIDFGVEHEEARRELEAKKREMDVEKAIRDIRTAIEQSKKASLTNPEKPNIQDDANACSTEDPVWITRSKNSSAPHGTSGLQTVSNVSTVLQHKLRHNKEEDDDDDDDEERDVEANHVTHMKLPGQVNRSRMKGVESDEESIDSEGNEVNYTHESCITTVNDDEEYFDDPEEKLRSLQLKKYEEYGADEETDELLDKQYNRSAKVEIPELSSASSNHQRQDEVNRHRKKAQEVAVRDGENETVLMEGVLFRAAYLGSTQLISEGQPSKAMRMMQAQEAVGRIKAPEGEHQPRTEVDLFVSVEKLMVLNTDLQEIMMDYSLRSISYIADVGDILVLMARRGPVAPPGTDLRRSRNQTRICCHLFESEEAHLIAQSIGQAFQVAYLGFLKANGIQHPGHLEEMDYQEVLNQQEIYGEELYLFSNKDMQREILIRKQKGEPLGVVIVESGWGSMVPTVVLANMCPTGAAARCGRLNIGDQIMSINDVSLVGLPLSTCQSYIKASKYHSVVKLSVVSCPPVVEVLIKRPDIKYQLGFSVQNGVICSLLRGGIAERGGVRVGHHIIEINGQSVVAVTHERIVNMLATSVGESIFAFNQQAWQSLLIKCKNALKLKKYKNLSKKLTECVLRFKA